ncbi:M48 family metallopeptidase [Shewanella cyperi]|uniref:M48 family metallopeptidase n=1 Tax=Shewanella cyperi TaxID=2814292 RepID=A0A975AJJ0_9GAMM|nr:M48 family metallopeptidase [Shewanella cyperi]QSX29115.1 M48 family metallopeptidase [Shewanella cyperi]
MKRLAISLLTLSLLGGCVTTQSPTGRSQTLLFSAAEMNQMGDASFDEMKKQQKISKDAKLNAYVDCVAQRVTGALEGPAQRWEVVVFDSPQVNAFALPGGHIGVYTGLLKVANNQDQLAVVLGHEVAHVLANHSNEQVSRAQMTGTGLKLADMALGAGGVANKDLYMAALGLGAQVGYILPYGRAQESEADIVGLELMARAGFDPRAGAILWQNMARAGGAQGPELLSTHPSHDTRISGLQSLAPKMLPLYDAAKAKGLPKCQIAK